MDWNWQQPDWPNFRYDAERLQYGEQLFQVESGVVAGASKHLGKEQRDELKIELLSLESVGTAAIEGEYLDRSSVQSSLRRLLGLTDESSTASPAEEGMAEMMLDLYEHFDVRLTHHTLFEWHRMIMSGRKDLNDPGRYRSGADPMQIVSGPIHDPNIHFEAPPSSRVSEEMDQFLEWFNATAPEGPRALPAVTRAGIAHLYFESIHPFEDGNGRIGRAVSEKTLAQSSGQPILTALAETIYRHRKEYYRILEASNRRLEITDWLLWFTAKVIEARKLTSVRIDFLIRKTRLMDDLRGKLNERQEKVLLRMLREGPDGFKGGLSAGNYASIARASPATITRDLADLVEKGALRKEGELKGTRYYLAIETEPVPTVRVDQIDA